MNSRSRQDRRPESGIPSPAEPGPAVGVPGPQPQQTAAERGTVFLVDDDEALRRALNRLLSSCGFRVLAFGSAEEFLAGYEPEQNGCLLLDMRMPGRNGLDLQAELERAGAGLPIVFLTGHADARTRQLALEHGAVAFLQKPAREPELLAAIDRALSRA